jgi:hypothetical protein
MKDQSLVILRLCANAQDLFDENVCLLTLSWKRFILLPDAINQSIGG